ncbi:MAG: GTPase [Singulisphaera sp.]
MSPVRAGPRLRADPAGTGRGGRRQGLGSAGAAVADAAFRPRRGPSLAESPPGRLRLGRMGAGIGDEVVAVVIASEPPEVEVYAHGGAAAVALVAEALVAEGAELRRPVAWVRHDARSAIAAEALVDLARAPTVRTAEILLEQAQGALEADVHEALAALADDPTETLDLVDTLLGRANVGLRLIGGWRVVLAGRPNVGKSRLLNALTGYDRAIVDATPGTTRDVVTARTALGGWPVELADTAGLRPSDDPIEASGSAARPARRGRPRPRGPGPFGALDRHRSGGRLRTGPWPDRRQQVRPPGGLDPRGPRRGRGLGPARRWDRGTGRDRREPARSRLSAPLPRRPLSSLPGPPSPICPRRPRGGRSRHGGPQPGRGVRPASPPVRSGGLREDLGELTGRDCRPPAGGPGLRATSMAEPGGCVEGRHQTTRQGSRGSASGPRPGATRRDGTGPNP